MPDLLNFLHRAKDILDKLQPQYQPGYLQFFCAAWQAQRNLIKAKSPNRRHYFQHKYQQLYEAIQQIQPTRYEQHLQDIFTQLDNIVQASSMVEAINSIIRPYLNTSKNNISQHLLNLIMFYHNNRIYRDGKRKGKSPLQLLLGYDQQKDWLTRLIEHIRQHLPFEI